MHRPGLRTIEQLTDAAVGFHKGEPWKVGPGGNRGDRTGFAPENLLLCFLKAFDLSLKAVSWNPSRQLLKPSRRLSDAFCPALRRRKAGIM